MCDSNGAEILMSRHYTLVHGPKLSNHNANEEASTEKQTCLWLKLLVGIYIMNLCLCFSAQGGT